MGQCASCIGAERRQSTDEDEEAQLIFGDANAMQYGSFGGQHHMRDEDPAETQRSIEALQRVVARTSDHLVDVFDIIPPERFAPALAPQFALANEDGRQARYQSLLARLSTRDETLGAKIEWLHQEEDGDVQQEPGAIHKVEQEGGEPLVGNFVDAAAAMR